MKFSSFSSTFILASLLVTFSSVSQVASQYVTLFAGNGVTSNFDGDLYAGQRKSINIGEVGDMQMDENGYLWYTHYISLQVSYIRVISPDGMVSPAGRGNFWFPKIKLGNNNKMYLIHRNEKTIYQIDINMEYKEFMKHAVAHRSIDMDENAVYVLSSNIPAIYKIFFNGTRTNLVPPGFNIHFKYPRFMKFNREKTKLFVADAHGEKQIVSVDMNGVMTTVIGCQPNNPIKNTLMNACIKSPKSFDWDSKGNMYIVGSNNSVFKASFQNNQVLPYVTFDRWPDTVVVDPFDNLFVSTLDAIHKVVAERPNGDILARNQKVSINKDNIIRRTILSSKYHLYFLLTIDSSSKSGNIIRFVKPGSENKSKMANGDSMLEVSYVESSQKLKLSVGIIVKGKIGYIELLAGINMSSNSEKSIKVTVNGNNLQLQIIGGSAVSQSLPSNSQVLSGDALVYTSDPWSTPASGSISNIQLKSIL